MDAIEQFRRALLPFGKYVKWLFLFGITVWTLSLVVGFYIGQINWANSLMVLALIIGAWLLHLNANYEKQE
jgi:type IV secretory pathway TrbL component